jgi:hypothetical protein
MKLGFGLLTSLLSLAFSTYTTGQEIPVRQETLGRWHYLHRLDELVYANTQGPRMASAFGPAGSRAAVLLPGSNLVCEFKEGHFFNLRFPADLTPCSLASDQNGRLYGLGQKLITSRDNFLIRWITYFNGKTWSRPAQVPFEPCDQIVFDRQNRLWALGPARVVAVKQGGTWDTFAYSDDKNLRFAPIRLVFNGAGDPVLFSYWQPWDLSKMVGTLTYRAGKFARDPQADTTTYIQAQAVKEPENATVPADPSAGDVIEEFRGLSARTQLLWNGYTLVSLGTDGLAWTGPADAALPALSVDQEWEAVPHVQFDPTLDPGGNLWILQRDPYVLEKISAGGTATFRAGPEAQHLRHINTIDFDTLGRPWLTSWHGDPREPVVVLEDGKLIEYRDPGTALRSESSKFLFGRILPFATKTPSGILAFGGMYQGAVNVIDGDKETRFEAEDIDPAEPAQRPTTGHGYNPFRNSDLWLDKSGSLHTRVLESDFLYANGQWTPSTLSQEKDSVVPPLPVEEGGPVMGSDESLVMPWNTSKTFYRGFHFYRQEAGGEKQLDFGLNALASYPFGSGHPRGTRSPGTYLDGRARPGRPSGRRDVVCGAQKIDAGRTVARRTTATL